MDNTGQIFQISRFADTLSFVIIPGNFLAKSDDCEILANEGLRTTGATLEDDDGSRFPGKSNPLQTRSLSGTLRRTT